MADPLLDFICGVSFVRHCSTPTNVLGSSVCLHQRERPTVRASIANALNQRFGLWNFDSSTSASYLFSIESTVSNTCERPHLRGVKFIVWHRFCEFTMMAAPRVEDTPP